MSARKRDLRPVLRFESADGHAATLRLQCARRHLEREATPLSTVAYKDAVAGADRTAPDRYHGRCFGALIGDRTG
ncbi:hypothetical protein [Streptomyces sp. NPDC002133]|uniref:hypothetical protein n=1 Tax=Streptomyces sp. NPDC002133 TaxID=3154409 RepID=UPI00332C33B2